MYQRNIGFSTPLPPPQSAEETMKDERENTDGPEVVTRMEENGLCAPSIFMVWKMIPQPLCHFCFSSMHGLATVSLWLSLPLVLRTLLRDGPCPSKWILKTPSPISVH